MQYLIEINIQTSSVFLFPLCVIHIIYLEFGYIQLAELFKNTVYFFLRIFFFFKMTYYINYSKNIDENSIVSTKIILVYTLCINKDD